MKASFVCLALTSVLLCSSMFANWMPPTGAHGYVSALGVSINKAFAGNWDGSICVLTDTGWTPVFYLPGNPNAVGPISCLAVSGANVFAGTYNSGIFLSSDNGTSWAPLDTVFKDKYGNVVPVLSFALSGTDLFAGTYDGVALSTDQGINWTALNEGLVDQSGRPHAVSCLAVDGGILYAGTTGQGVFVSTSYGSAWNPTALTTTNVSSLAPANGNLFAATDGGAFRSTNNGGTWTPVITGLTFVLYGIEYPWYIRFFAASGPNIYAGAPGGGVGLSTDNGESWAVVGSGFADTSLSCIAVNGTTIYAGTPNGVWMYAPDNTFIGQNVSVQPVDAATGTSPVSVTFDNVQSNGYTSLWTLSSGPAPPGTFQLVQPNIYYDIRTTAQWSGQVTVCVSYHNVVLEIPDNPVLLHYEEGQWVNTNATVYPSTETICGTVTSLSPFTIVEPLTLHANIDVISKVVPNPVQSNSLIPVGILSSDAFDASSVVISSVRFGPQGATTLLEKAITPDLNGDRKPDLLLSFVSKETGIQPGDTSAKLYGKTVSGQWFVGKDAIRTTGPGKHPAEDETVGVPTVYKLEQNYPNPFNPTTSIKYQIPRLTDGGLASTNHVKLTVYDMLGREVATLVDRCEGPGYKSVQWDASGLSSGVYMYRLTARQIGAGQTETFAQTKKLLLMK